jgi:Uri superfamily endonuclease
VAGAYALLLVLGRPCAFETRLLGPVVLAPGRYLYAGSAWGPGGIRARVARHARADKRARWHIDHLTRRARFLGAFAVPGGRECDLVARLLPLPGVDVPVRGLGSSDCSICPAHLLSVPATVAPQGLLGIPASGGAR